MTESKPIQKTPENQLGPQPWTDLFASENIAGAAVQVEFRVLRKRGEPFLLLPRGRQCAAQALALYAAQSTRARLARRLARLLVATGLTAVGERQRVSLEPDQPFPKFLRELVSAKKLPPVAILAGNPRQPGRRFVILVFGADAKPAAVVKAGHGFAAKELIRREVAGLKSTTKGKQGIPVVRAEYDSPTVSAFATDFVPGDAPRAPDAARVSGILLDWLERDRVAAIGELPQWRQLQQAWSGDPIFASLPRELAATFVHPTISHGDFAPWNIRVAQDGSWVVLDWERGERTGIPGWDWFHFLLQPLLLVERRPTPHIADRVETFLAAPEFRAYAATARIAGLERALLQSYLGHMLHIIRPAEGMKATEELLKLLTQRWRPARGA